MVRALALAAALMAGTAAPAALPPPAELPDPYLWLEEVSGARALAWVEAENKRSLGVLEGDPRYAGFYADALRIAEASDRIPMPSQLSAGLSNFWQDGDHVRGLWRIATPASYATPAPEWRTLVDLDRLSAAEKANWVWHGANPEPVGEKRALVSLSDGGEDASTVREYDLAAGGFVAGGFTLPTAKQRFDWDGPDALYVARDWGAGTTTASGYPFVVKHLRRGEPLAAAAEVLRGAPTDETGMDVTTYVDGAGRQVTIAQRGVTFFESEVSVLEGGRPRRLDLPRKQDVRGLAQGRLIVQLNQDWAPAGGGGPFAAGTVVAVDPAGRAPPERVFEPNAHQTVDEVAVAHDRVLAVVLDDVRGRAMVFARGAADGSGRWQGRPLPLPDNATVNLVSADRASDTAYLGVQSFLAPPSLWQVDVAAGTAREIKTSPPRFDAAGLVTEQHFATSKDGTRVPYFVVRRRDAKPDGSTPTVLSAYGGFLISETPRYAGQNGKLWLERGGAYVLANIRGGAEYGPKWHEAALKLNRQRAYDDFAAVAEDLIRRRITSPRRLGIVGGSNGGLLMGVQLTQRPELWHAVSIEVPLLDMLRYEKLSAGSSWVGEYGSVANPAERANLARISPYNNLRRGTAYPETFIWTTTKDDRVGPVQARKFAARMKEYGLPYLYYENTEGGHGAGANLRQSARTKALEMVYFTRRLMDDPTPPPTPIAAE